MRFSQLLIALFLIQSPPTQSAELLENVMAIYQGSRAISNPVGDTLVELHGMYLKLFRAFAESYGNLEEASTSPCNFNAREFARWQKAFELDFKSSQPSEKFRSLNDLAKSHGYNLKIYSPKIWQHLFRNIVHTNDNLLTVLLTKNASVQSFFDEIRSCSTPMPTYMGAWLDDLALFIGLDTNVNVQNFLALAQTTALFNAIFLTEERKTIYEYLVSRLPVYYLDDHYPELVITPKTQRPKERDQFNTLLLKVRLLKENAGQYSYNQMNSKQDKVFVDALKAAGFKENFARYPRTHRSGVSYFLNEWRILEGGLSTPKERQDLLDKFASKTYEMSAYLDYRSNDDFTDGLMPESVKLIHSEVLAALGQKSSELVERKVSQYSKPKAILERDLAIVQKIKDDSIWDEIIQKREQLKSSIFLDVLPPAPQKIEKEAPLALAANEQKRAKRKNRNKPKAAAPTTSANVAQPKIVSAPLATTDLALPAVTRDPSASHPKKKRRTRKRKLPQTVSPIMPANLLEDGFPLTTPAVQSEKEIIRQELKRQRKKVSNAVSDDKPNTALVPSAKPEKKRHARPHGWSIPKPLSVFRAAKNLFTVKKRTLGDFIPKQWQTAFLRTATTMAEQGSKYSDATRAASRHLGAAEKLHLEFLTDEFESTANTLQVFGKEIDGPAFDCLMTDFNRQTRDAVELAIAWRQFHPEYEAPLIDLHRLLSAGQMYLNEVEQAKAFKDALLARVQEAEENLSSLRAMLENPDQKYSLDEIYQTYSTMPIPPCERQIVDSARVPFVIFQLRIIVGHLEAWNQTMRQWLMTSDIIEEPIYGNSDDSSEEDINSTVSTNV